MKQSETITETPKELIYSKMIAILRGVGGIAKNKKNPQQGYMFRGIDDMYNALHEHFAEHGVFIASDVLSTTREERQTKAGGNLIYTIAKCKFVFYAEDGSSITSIIEGEAMDSGDKSMNKALSAALKYALMQMFLIPTNEKLDTENETHEVTAKVTTPAPATPAPAPATKPKLSQLDDLNFKKAKARILAGETELYAKIKTMFEIKPDFDAALKQAVLEATAAKEVKPLNEI